MNPITLFTVGFARKSAERFFTLLEDAGVRKVVDIRLHNTSQLAGFAKQEDLRFFLKRVSGIDYMHVPLLAPTEELLKAFQKKDILWPEYEQVFRRLLKDRSVLDHLEPDLYDRACLLCSEPDPDHCHRRLVAEHLKAAWKQVAIHHLT
jgi:uncharacterized protein (DUF488 family)